MLIVAPFGILAVTPFGYFSVVKSPSLPSSSSQSSLHDVRVYASCVPCTGLLFVDCAYDADYAARRLILQSIWFEESAVEVKSQRIWK